MSLSQHELNDLKTLLNDTTLKFLGFNEPSLVAAALNCVTKGYDKKKTVDKLSDLLDSGQANSFADKIFSAYDDYRASNKHSKYKRKKDEVEEVKEVKVKKRRFMDDDEAATIPAPGTPSPGALTNEKIKEMMANARKELQERKAQLGIQPTPPAPASVTAVPQTQTPSSKSSSSDPSNKINDLHAQIQARLMNLPMGLRANMPAPQPLMGGSMGGPGGMGMGGMNMPPPLIPGLGQQNEGLWFGQSLLSLGLAMGLGGYNMGMSNLGSSFHGNQYHSQYHSQSTSGKKKIPPLIPIVGYRYELMRQSSQMSKPTPVILNELGQTIDAKTGQTIQLSHYTPTLKANIRAKRREQFKGLIEKPPEEASDSKFFDTRMSLKGPTRQRRGFKFHERGKFESLATRLRAKAQLERLQTEIAQTAKRTGIASAAKLATIIPKKELQEGEVPDIEWWDAVIVGKDSYDTVTDSADRKVLEGITHLVEHPIQLKPPADKSKDVTIPVYLTKKERKKLRRQNRTEAEKELQEKIRIGLAPQPEPKVRMANLMRVLGTEAVQDPTKVEAHVRAQMAKRQRQHEEANAARKLTPEQLRDKKIRKIKEDTSLGVHVAVYRIRDLLDPSHKFKIETNAKQLFMTGFVVLYKECNVVAVEGGPKQQRKFKRLMMHRIKWNEGKKHAKGNDDDSDEEEGVDTSNKCVLVWEGVVKNRAFGEMKFKVCPTVSFAHEQFKKCGVAHYWDQAFSGAVLETAGED